MFTKIMGWLAFVFLPVWCSGSGVVRVLDVASVRFPLYTSANRSSRAGLYFGQRGAPRRGQKIGAMGQNAYLFAALGYFGHAMRQFLGFLHSVD